MFSDFRHQRVEKRIAVDWKQTYGLFLLLLSCFVLLGETFELLFPFVIEFFLHRLCLLLSFHLEVGHQPVFLLALLPLELLLVGVQLLLCLAYLLQHFYDSCTGIRTVIYGLVDNDELECILF